jgi:prepilin peptidase CpaA
MIHITNDLSSFAKRSVALFQYQRGFAGPSPDEFVIIGGSPASAEVTLPEGKTDPMIEAVILAAVAALLTFVVVDDLRNLRIRNEAVVALALLFLFDTVLTGHYREGLAHAAFAAVMTSLILVFYAKGVMGGGDVKLLGVAFLWLGTEHSFVFSLLLLVFTLAYALLGKLGALPRQMVAARAKIPFGPSIGAAWLLTAAPWEITANMIARARNGMIG